MESRESRSRIKLLEKDDSYTTRLVHVVGQLEKSMEDAVAEMIDEAGNSDSQVASVETLASPKIPSTTGPIETSLPAETSSSPSSASPVSSTVSELLTEGQRRIVTNLNRIPQLKKQRVFIHPVMNSHATIVARDVQRFKFHELGHGVLRHMADHFTV